MKDLGDMHTLLINNYIKKHQYKSYLEIGTGDGKNFNQIKCLYKLSVDPDNNARSATHKMTSDDFFNSNDLFFDFIFVDGLHEKDQVIKDIQNSLKYLNKGGIIMVHDCLPSREREQLVPRESKVWTGDVWKAWVYFRSFDNLNMYVFDIDHGIGIIKRGAQKTIHVKPEDLTWNNFKDNKEDWLNLIDFPMV